MKKNLSLLFLLILTPLYAFTLPQELYGIWEGKDRIIFIEENPTEITIILKEFYGWYYDRVAEPSDYAQKNPRTRNNATTRNAEHVFIDDFALTYQNENNLAGELKLKYSNRQKNYIPIALINDNLYLNFMQKVDFQPQTDTSMDTPMSVINGNATSDTPMSVINGNATSDTPMSVINGNVTSATPIFYQGSALSKGFLVSEQSIPQNIKGFLFITENDTSSFFDIRYWKTDMDFSTENANLNWKDNQYLVPKHIFTGGNNYSCVSGRSKKIRNVPSPQNYTQDDFYFTDDKILLIQTKEPYLTKIADKKTLSDLIQIVQKANSRRKPDPKPLFPPNDADWHWDVIDYLEKDNALIQAVRQRQKDFGLRAKDMVSN